MEVGLFRRCLRILFYPFRLMGRYFYTDRQIRYPRVKISFSGAVRTFLVDSYYSFIREEVRLLVKRFPLWFFGVLLSAVLFMWKIVKRHYKTRKDRRSKKRHQDQIWRIFDVFYLFAHLSGRWTPWIEAHISYFFGSWAVPVLNYYSRFVYIYFLILFIFFMIWAYMTKGRRRDTT